MNIDCMNTLLLTHQSTNARQTLHTSEPNTHTHTSNWTIYWCKMEMSQIQNSKLFKEAVKVFSISCTFDQENSAIDMLFCFPSISINL